MSRAAMPVCIDRKTRRFRYVGRQRAFQTITFILSTGAGPGAPRQEITMLTTGPLNPSFDTMRLRRMMRRLKALGFRLNWSALCHPTDGIGGTIKMYKPHDDRIKQ